MTSTTCVESGGAVRGAGVIGVEGVEGVMTVRSSQGMRARPPPSGRDASRSEQGRIGTRRCAGGDTGTGRADDGVQGGGVQGIGVLVRDQHGPDLQDRGLQGDSAQRIDDIPPRA